MDQLYLARAVHLDESDMAVYHNPARTGEWCLSGGFEFSDVTEGELVGKTRQAFAHGWLGLETFGRVSVIAVARIEPFEIAALKQALARHFVEIYGAGTVEAALPLAGEEVDHMVEMCSGLDENALLTVARSLTEHGVREQFSVVDPQAASLDQFAVHVSDEGLG